MSYAGMLTTKKAAEDFLFAGNATLTLVSLKSNLRFTFKVQVKKEALDSQPIAHLDGSYGITSNSKVNYKSYQEAEKAAKEERENPVYFVKLLNGQDNENDYQYMGILRRTHGLIFTGASKVKPNSPSAIAFSYFLQVLKARKDEDSLPEMLEVWHEGRCARCGRKLTVPESISSGFGPECIKRAA
jgi:hypothetical protein